MKKVNTKLKDALGRGVASGTGASGYHRLSKNVILLKKPASKNIAKKPVAKISHPSYNYMIAAAIESLKKRNGSSREAIMKYIFACYNFRDESKAEVQIKMALRRGVASGALKQVKGKGVVGSFKVVKGKDKLAKKFDVRVTEKPVAKPYHPSYNTMIVVAILTLNKRSGLSRQAIMKFIFANFNFSDEKKATTQLKMALRRGVSSGTLKQVKGSGVVGSFKLAKGQSLPPNWNLIHKYFAKKQSVKKATKKTAIRKVKRKLQSRK